MTDKKLPKDEIKAKHRNKPVDASAAPPPASASEDVPAAAEATPSTVPVAAPSFEKPKGTADIMAAIRAKIAAGVANAPTGSRVSVPKPKGTTGTPSVEHVSRLPVGAAISSFRVANMWNPRVQVLRVTLEVDASIYQLMIRAPTPSASVFELAQVRIADMTIVQSQGQWTLLVDSDRGHIEISGSSIVVLKSPLTTAALSASDDEIREMVVNWFEHMCAGDFDKAFAMFAHDASDWEWTPELLRETIRCYGVPGIERETIDSMCDGWGVREFVVTSLYGREDTDEIFDSIEIEREDSEEELPARYLGWVHFWNLPLCNRRSDLTARFRIVKVGDDRLTLELHDIHVL